jgi:NADPH:quinone reductase-like Zn-dependent oxidoreductase
MGSGLSGTARALWYVAPGVADVRPVDLAPGDGETVTVRTLFTALSRGTERLVFEGRVPEPEQARMRCPFQDGDFPFPVKYGYQAVGLVETGPAALIGRTVFVLYPHQNRFRCPASMAVPVPDNVPARRASLAANMETALNGLWDSGAGPADRIVVVGGGVVGLLSGYLAAGLPGAQVTLVEPDAGRRAIAASLGLETIGPDAAPGGADVVIHASASASGLATAFASAGKEATVVELSWYGSAPVPAPLGGAFHSQRLKLVSSQVGEVSPGRRPRWTYRRRMEAALRLLADHRLDALITDEIAFAEAPARLPALLAPGAPGLTAVLRY